MESYRVAFVGGSVGGVSAVLRHDGPPPEILAVSRSVYFPDGESGGRIVYRVGRCGDRKLSPACDCPSYSAGRAEQGDTR